MVRGKLTFISGGVRSGKSTFAEQQLVQKAQRQNGRLIYIASGVKTDLEMAKRIDKHQIDREKFNWTTYEQPLKVEELLPFIQSGDLILWDCLTTWLANELYEGWETNTPCIQEPDCMAQKEKQLYNTIDVLLEKASELIIVSNEVLDELRGDGFGRRCAFERQENHALASGIGSNFCDCDRKKSKHRHRNGLQHRNLLEEIIIS